MDFFSDQKKWVRDNVWDEAIKKLIDSGLASEELKIFELIGPDCIYANHLIEKYKIDPTNIIAIESNEIYTPRLLINSNGRIPYFNTDDETFSKDVLYEDLFPFNFINLDYCGQLFSFNSKGELQKRWASIEAFINQNQSLDCFYLLLTHMVERNSPKGYSFLEKEWKEIANNPKANTKIISDDWESAMSWVVPDMICQYAAKFAFNIANEDLKVINYRQSGKVTSMMSYRFLFKKSVNKTFSPSAFMHFCQSALYEQLSQKNTMVTL